MKHLLTAFFVICTHFHMPIIGMESNSIEFVQELPDHCIKKILFYTISSLTTQQQSQLLCSLQLPHKTIKPPVNNPHIFFNDHKLCVMGKVQHTSEQNYQLAFLESMYTGHLRVEPNFIEVNYQYDYPSDTWKKIIPKSANPLSFTSPITALRDSDHDESQPLTVRHPTQNVTVITYAPEQYLNNKPITLQDNESELPIHRFTADGVHDFVLSPDGNQIACFNRKETYQTKMIHLWNLQPLIKTYALLKGFEEECEKLPLKEYLNLYDTINSLNHPFSDPMEH